MTRSENSLNGGETVAKEPFGFFRIRGIPSHATKVLQLHSI